MAVAAVRVRSVAAARAWKGLRATMGLLGVLWPLHASAQNVSFRDASSELGVLNSEISYGATWGDLEGDGWPDLFLSNHYRSPIVLRNSGGQYFENVTASSPLAFKVDYHTCKWADFDLDRDTDLFCSTGANYGTTPTPSRLMISDGNGGFEDMALSYGIEFPDARGRTVTWIDLDGDQDLDLFYGTYRVQSSEPLPRLYRNDGNYFTDITPADTWGLDGRISHSIATDLDGDGDQDLVVGFIELAQGLGPCASCVVFLVNDGLGRLSVVAGPSIGLNGGWQLALALGDFDNDGDLDVFQGNKQSAALHRRNSDGTYSRADLSSVGLGDVLTAEVRDAGWFDFNNDGWLDLYVVRGITGSSVNAPNALYINKGDGTFTERAALYGAQGLSQGQGDAFAVADYDANGFLDLIIANGEGTTQGRYQLLKNQGNANHWLRVVLTASDGSPMHGGKVALLAGGVWQYREFADQAGPRSSHQEVMHFGLGSASVVSSLRVTWPDGTISEYASLPVDAVMEIRQDFEPPPAPGDFFQGADGIVSMEAENFSVAESWQKWAMSGASFDNGVRSQSGARTALDVARRVEYPIKFARSGPHYVWLRMRAYSDAGNELRVGLSGAKTFWRGVQSLGSWQWVRVQEGTINVSTDGSTIFKIYRIEGDVEVDKILITPDSQYQPTGYGPPETRSNSDDNTPPLRPEGLVASAEGWSEVAVSWSDVAGEAEYELERATGDGGFEVVATVAADVTGYVDTGLSGSTVYRYRVRAGNQGGLSEYSEEASVRTLAAPPVMPVLVATGVSALRVDLSWEDVAEESGYRLRRDGVEIAALPAEATVYEDTGVSAGTSYVYELQAWNGQGESGWSTVQVTTPNVLPGVPTNVLTSVNGPTVTIAWMAGSPPSQSFFEIRREALNKRGKWGSVTTLAAAGADETSITDQPGIGTYRYRISAVNDVGSSADVVSPEVVVNEDPSGGGGGGGCKGKACRR